MAFALVADNTLYLKADTETKPHFEQAGLPAFRPFPDQDMVMSYHLAPADLFESEDGLRKWGAWALAAAQRAKKPRPKRRAASQ